MAAFVPLQESGPGLGKHKRLTTMCSDWSSPDSDNGTNAAIRILPDPCVYYIYEGCGWRDYCRPIYIQSNF